MKKASSALRIAILTDDFYPHSGGVARSIELQIAELTASGHQVTLFAPKTHFTPPENCAYEALDVWRISGTPSYLCSLRFGRKLAERIAKQYKFDVIHTQNERGAMFLGAQLARLMRIPHVHTFHSNYAATHRTSPFASALNSLTYLHLAPLIMRHYCPEKDKIKVYFPRQLSAAENSTIARADWKNIARLARFTDAFTSPAQFMIEAIVDASRGQLGERAFVVPNGVASIFNQAQRIRPAEETVRFLSCCRLDPEKRVDVIIKAFAKLKRDNAELYIVGSGSQDQKLRRLAERIVTRGRVVFLGKYDDIERLANEYANADAFVFASYRFDTQGMVLAEAAAAGTPIIYCDGRLEIGVTPNNALLVNPSASALAVGMRRLADDPNLRLKMATASKEVGQSLSATTMMDKFTGVYRYALETQPLIQLNHETPQFSPEHP